MNSNDKHVISKLFDDYLRMYAVDDASLLEHFSEDSLVKNQQDWLAVIRQDFTQIQEPLRIECKDLAIQLISDTIAVTTGLFTIYVQVEEQALLPETARLVLILRKESSGWKISHSKQTNRLKMTRLHLYRR